MIGTFERREHERRRIDADAGHRGIGFARRPHFVSSTDQRGGDQPGHVQVILDD
jgi:hypothetical protein